MHRAFKPAYEFGSGFDKIICIGRCQDILPSWGSVAMHSSLLIRDLLVLGQTQYEAGTLPQDWFFRSSSVLFWLLSSFKVLCMLGSRAYHKSADSNTGFMRSCSASESKVCKLCWECPVTLLTLTLSLQLFQHRLCFYKELNSQWWYLYSVLILASSHAALKNNSKLNISWVNGANTAGSSIKKLTFFHHLPERPTSPTLESTDD